MAILGAGCVWCLNDWIIIFRSLLRKSRTFGWSTRTKTKRDTGRCRWDLSHSCRPKRAPRDEQCGLVPADDRERNFTTDSYFAASSNVVAVCPEFFMSNEKSLSKNDVSRFL